MTAHAVRIELPEGVYERLERLAARSQRTIEAEVVAVVAGALQEAENLPQDLEDELAALALLNDERLWRAARRRVPLRSARRLRRLNWKAQAEGLADNERLEQRRLLRLCDRVMLIRAQAAVLLKERGHDITVLQAIP